MQSIHLKTSIALVLSLVSLTSFADIYEYIDDAGVSHFSDAPDDDNYVLIIQTEQIITEATQTASVGRISLRNPPNENMTCILKLSPKQPSADNAMLIRPTKNA